MEVSGQRHAPAALLPPGKGPPVPIGEEAGWASEPVWTQRLQENPLPLPGIEPRSPGRPARSQTLYPDFPMSDSIKLTIFTASSSRFCRLVFIFFARRECRCSKQCVHTAVDMWVSCLTVNPLVFHVIAFAPTLHVAMLFLPACAIAASRLNKQNKEPLSCCMTRY
jgi:hypothetical protein